MTVADHLLYALAWLSFGVLHSLLARQKANRSFDAAFGKFARIAYNLIAAVHLGAILFFEWRGFPGKVAFDVPLWLHAPMVAVQVAGWVLLFVALVQYDLGRFGGLTQARVIVHRRGRGRGAGPMGAARELPEPPPDVPQARLEPLVTHGIHRYVRHPLYSAMMMVFWGRAFDEAALMTAAWGTLYLVIGTHFEERKLLQIYGADYARYSAAVPRFLPLRGRARSEQGKSG
ncbi:MAG: isoprenylcysteine carboxylmethyltransferase family protein [Rhodospirillaceae bacterium]|nr:isoprenylcysteine carboxylmethyltransferase family protein [Rhodospirillaceae bacterium]MDE0619596.1 isoprenylcysteine carboxylmethyltransferase family protein [Rhodospirillaceae bacterium]